MGSPASIFIREIVLFPQFKVSFIKFNLSSKLLVNVLRSVFKGWLVVKFSLITKTFLWFVNWSYKEEHGKIKKKKWSSILVEWLNYLKYSSFCFLLLILMILFYVIYLFIFSLFYIICCYCCYFVHYYCDLISLKNKDETILSVNHVAMEVTAIFLKLSLVIRVILSDVLDQFKHTP